MIKCFVTGDVHIGKKYDRYPEIKEKLIHSRFDCLDRCIKQAETENCDFFIITGDLFDNINGIKVSDVKKVVDILSKFGGRVIVLPGNHDYYTGEEKVWKDFDNALSKVDHNILLITEFKEVMLECGEETVSFYPAFCQSKHAQKNNLGWIKEKELNDSTYHIGLAHGALAGLSPDMKNEYFLMTEKELNDIPMDVWFIGHTHIPYPADLSDIRDVEGYKIYNPGTPEQTDLSNNTSGVCFVVTLDKSNGKTTVSAHSYQSGAINYKDIQITVRDHDLEQSIQSAIDNLPNNCIIRLTLNGPVTEDQYAQKSQIYDELLNGFMSSEVVDDDLSELITKERIRSEFAEIGFAYDFLNALEDSKELQLAYELVKKYQG